MLKIASQYAASNPNKIVVVSPPLCRQSPIWFFDQYQFYVDIFNTLCDQIKFNNFFKSSTPEYKDLAFSSDLIHLTPECGEHYVNGLFEFATI